MNTDIFISFGSNCGDREKNIARAMDLLASKIGKILKYSSLYETQPWGFESNYWFYNNVVKIRTSLSTDFIMKELLQIESQMGRKRTVARYSDRIIDIDLLFYGNKIIKSDDLIVPHPRLHLRRFVLLPLCEIEPDFIHPCFEKTVAELLAECDDKALVLKIN